MKVELDDILKLLKDACQCSDGYKERKLIDPKCQVHEITDRLKYKYGLEYTSLKQFKTTEYFTKVGLSEDWFFDTYGEGAIKFRCKGCEDIILCEVIPIIPCKHCGLEDWEECLYLPKNEQ